MPECISNGVSITGHELDYQEERETVTEAMLIRQMHRFASGSELFPPIPAPLDIPLTKLAEMKLIRVNFTTLKVDNEVGVLVPLCIAGPLIHLLEITRKHMQNNCKDDNLFTDILGNKALESDENFRNHMMDFMLTNPYLGYNQYVQLVGNGCHLFCFHLIGHLLEIWDSKLCPISKSHCECAEKINFFDVRQPFSPIRRIKLNGSMISPRVSADSDANIDQFTLTLINKLNIEMYCDLEDIADTTVKNTVKLIFLVFMALIQLYLEGQAAKPLDGPLDIMNAARLNVIGTYKIMKTMAEVIAVPLMRVPDTWYAGYCRSQGPAPPEIKDQLAQRLFIHFLTMNSGLVFHPERVNISDALLHIMDKDIKSQCICQYVNIKVLFDRGISSQKDVHSDILLRQCPLSYANPASMFKHVLY